MAPVADPKREAGEMWEETCDLASRWGRGGRKLGVCCHPSMSRRLFRALGSISQHAVTNFTMEQIETWRSRRSFNVTYKLKGGGGIATGVPIGMVLQREPLIRSNDGLDSGSLIDFENHVKVLCNRRRRHLASEDGSPQGSGGFSSITHDGGDRCLAQSSIAVRTSSQTHIPVLTVLQRGI